MRQTLTCALIVLILKRVKYYIVRQLLHYASVVILCVECKKVFQVLRDVLHCVIGVMIKRILQFFCSRGTMYINATFHTYVRVIVGLMFANH